jgi:predicted transcriptional regulator
MTTLIVRLGTVDDAHNRLIEAARRAEAGETFEAEHSVNFASYDSMHKVLAPSRLAIVKTLAGQGVLSIREVARRVNRDVQAVHRDVTTLVNAGVVDRTESGVAFPYDRIHFEYDVSAAA